MASTKGAKGEPVDMKLEVVAHRRFRRGPREGVLREARLAARH